MTDTTGAPSAPSAEEPPKRAQPAPRIPVTDEIVAEVRDALKLLDYAIANGIKKEGATISEDLVSKIKSAAAAVGAYDTPGANRRTIAPSQWAQFEVAYHRLAVLLSPVTAETLKNTEDPSEKHRTELGSTALARLRRFFFVGSSPAVGFTRLLWFFAIIFALIVIFGDWWVARYGPVQEGYVDPENTVLQLLRVATPYAYGGLGACAYLLRSAHVFIYERTFDVHRKSEYLSRILLGAISGGAIILFIGQVAGDDATVIYLSSAALGFIAGYSNDFLFNTIERVVSALLPKVGLQSIRQATPPSRPPMEVLAGGLTLKDLLDRLDEAEGPDKELIKSLIEKLRDRL